MRATELQERIDSTASSISRLREVLQGDISTLLHRDGDDHDADIVAAPGEAHGSENAATATTISEAQRSRLYRQAILTRDVLEQQRDRDILQLEHFNNALEVHRAVEAESASATGKKKRQRAQDEAEASVKHYLEEAELVRLRNSLVHIAEDVGGSTAVQCKPRTILSWVREFVKLGGYFKRDSRGVHEREFILDQEDLQLQLLGWLKSEKRVSTRRTQEYINNVLFGREGGMLRLAEYGLTLPICKTTTHAWMIKLGCNFDRAKQSYYSDGHERADVVEHRGEYTRRRRRLALCA